MNTPNETTTSDVCHNCNGSGVQRGPTHRRTKDKDIEFVKQPCVYCEGTGKKPSKKNYDEKKEEM